MKLLGAADLHLDAAHLTTLDDQRRALDHVCEIVEDRGIQVVLLAGDTTHHARPTPEVLELIGSFFGRLDRAGAEVVIVAGNHDPHVPAVAQHFRGRVHAVYAPEPGGALPVIHLDGLDIACLPYLPDGYVRAAAAGTLPKEEVAARLSFAARSILAGFRAQRRPGVPMVLVGHFTVAGSETPTGFSMGWVPGTTWVVPVEDLVDFDVVFAGHVHRRQSPVPHVIVPGSLLPLDFSETEEKGVTVVELWPSPATAPDIEFVRIPTPTVATWDWDDAAVRAQVPMPAVFTPGRAADLVRVRVRCSEETAREFPPARIEAQLLRAGARKVQVELTVERPDRARDADMTSELLPLTALGRYIDGRTDIEAEAKDRIAAAGTVAVGDVLADPALAATGDLRLTRIQVENFLGVAAADLDVSGIDVAALVGPVGMGKSTLGCDAIRFALFGVTRQGARSTERIVRQGERSASVALELAGADGHTYRIVRKVAVDGRGRASTTLDVLEHLPLSFEYRPLSTGKVADGEAQIARILGSLTDAVLVAANLVVQRDAARFATARPEERKDLLSEAAGLDVYGDLQLRTAKHLNETERELASLEAQAEGLRPRAELVPRLEAELLVAERERDAADVAVKDLERQHTEATEAVERATDRAATYERNLDEAKRIHADVERLEAERAEWERKAGVAREMVARRAELEAARTELADVRRHVQEVLDAERQEREAAGEREGERSAAIARRAEIQAALQRARAQREKALASVDAELRAARRQQDELAESGCLERCAHVEACTVRSAADENAARIRDLEEQRKRHAAVPQAETDLEAELAAVVVPDRLPVQERTVVLDQARRKEHGLERAVQVADKIAAAEAVLAEHDAAVAKLRMQLLVKRDELGKANAPLAFVAGDPRAERDRAVAKQRDVAEQLRERRAMASESATRAAMFTGRLEELRAAAAELVGIEERIGERATAAAAWKELAFSWRACRVMVLETSVIPAVEEMANDVLRRFPYGLQLRLVTQREKKSGDGLAETLDIEILGGKAPVYELLSGGQATSVDVSLHLAIALVVSRRQRTRLQWLTLDEPEGLDAEGRAAFAAIARWCHDTFGLATLVSSHHEDLVDQLGARIIRIDGEAGNAHVGVTAAAELEAVPT